MKDRKARKDHRCTLCHKVIQSGTTYKWETITPWSHPDNERYSEYKAHVDCDTLWLRIGNGLDWIFPQNASEWEEELEALARNEADHA